jgi:hypothetical protein
MSTAVLSAWPKHRLQIRSVLSATMSIGWVWVAATALIPYFVIGRGRGAGSIEFLGIARTTWLSFHVWSSIVIGLLTIGHVVLNRRGLTRSYRILSGASHPAARTNEVARRGGRGLAWIAAVALIVLTVGGSWAFASVAERPTGSGSTVSQVEHDRGDDRAVAAGDSAQARAGGQHRGGRGGGP